MDYNDVLKIKETQRSEQERYDIQTKLAQSNIEKLLSTEAARQITVPQITEIESTIFSLKSELFSYIQAKGLVDGLVWNGVLQPVKDRKIVITKDMIKKVTDSIYTKELKKLAGIEEGAEVNKIIDVIFNGESILDSDSRIATLTITPEDIKHWYESNPDTNAYTDAEKALVAAIPDITKSITDIDEKQAEQDERLDTLEAEQTEQNERLTAIETEQTEQNTRLSDLEAGQTVQDKRLDSIEAEQVTQNTNIEINKTNIEVNKTNLETEIANRKHADEDIQAKYDAEIKRIDQVNEHLQHEVDTKVKDVLLDGISVCDENRNAQLDSDKISKVLDVKVNGDSVVNAEKIADIDTADFNLVTDVKVDGKSVVTDKVANINLDDTKVDSAVQINIDGSETDIISVDENNNRKITVDANTMGVLEDVTLDGESVIRYDNASNGRKAVINSKVKDVQLDGKSIIDSDKVANIDTTNFGKVDDVKVDGETVVIDKVANIDLKVTDVKVDGKSVVTDKTANIDTTDICKVKDVTLDDKSVVVDGVAKLSSSSFGEIKDVQVDGTTIVDSDTKIANLDTTNLGGINLNTLKTSVETNTSNIADLTTKVDANTSDISAIKTEQTTQNTNIEKNTNDISGLDTNFADLSQTVDTNTTNIESVTNRVLTLENLQSLVPSNAYEADIAVFTIPKGSTLVIENSKNSTKTEGYYYTTRASKFGIISIDSTGEVGFSTTTDLLVGISELDYREDTRPFRIVCKRIPGLERLYNEKKIIYFSSDLRFYLGNMDMISPSIELRIMCDVNSGAIYFGQDTLTADTYRNSGLEINPTIGSDSSGNDYVEICVANMFYGRMTYVASYSDEDQNFAADLSSYITADYYKFLPTTTTTTTTTTADEATATTKTTTKKASKKK